MQTFAAGVVSAIADQILVYKRCGVEQVVGASFLFYDSRYLVLEKLPSDCWNRIYPPIIYIISIVKS